MKNTLKNLFALGLGLLLSLALLECLFRAAAWFFPQTPLTDANPNAYRILCVGDSSTYGQGAAHPETTSYPAVLQELLTRENKTPVQVVNLGLPGINSTQALALLNKNAERLKPNLILVCVGVNDPWNLEQSGLLKNYSGSGLETWKLTLLRWIQKSKVRRFCKLLLVKRDFPKNGEPCPEFDAQTVEKNNRLLPDLEQQKQALKETLRQNFLEITRIATAQHAQIFFLEYHAPGWQNPEQTIHALYTELNLKTIPVSDYFQTADNLQAPIRSQDGWHPNDTGYRLLAELVCNELHEKIPVKAKLFYPTKQDWEKRLSELRV